MAFQLKKRIKCIFSLKTSKRKNQTKIEPYQNRTIFDKKKTLIRL